MHKTKDHICIWMQHDAMGTKGVNDKTRFAFNEGNGRACKAAKKLRLTKGLGKLRFLDLAFVTVIIIITI